MRGLRGNMGRSMRRDRGAVLVAALVALLIVMSLLGTMLLGAIAARRQLRAERQLRQCELLLRAGIDRAAAQKAKDAAYRGETWQLSKGALPGGEARVLIAVRPAAADMPATLEITAEYPLGDESSIRRTFTGTFTTRPPRPEEN